MSQRHYTLLSRVSFMKTLWNSMLLIRLVKQLWLISVSNFGQHCPGRKYKLLNRHRIGGPLLEPAYEQTAASVQPIMDRAKYGGTLTSDGWSDVQRRAIANFMRVIVNDNALANGDALANGVCAACRAADLHSAHSTRCDGIVRGCCLISNIALVQ